MLGSAPLSSPRRRPPPSSSRGPSSPLRAAAPRAHTPARSANPRRRPRPPLRRPANPGSHTPVTNGKGFRRLPSPGKLRKGAGKGAGPARRRGGAGRVSGQRWAERRGQRFGACPLLANRVPMQKRRGKPRPRGCEGAAVAAEPGGGSRCAARPRCGTDPVRRPAPLHGGQPDRHRERGRGAGWRCGGLRRRLSLPLPGPPSASFGAGLRVERSDESGLLGSMLMHGDGGCN